MNKILLVARREFLTNLRRPSFLFSVFGTPIIVAVALFLSIGLESGSNSIGEYRPVGVFDGSDRQVMTPGLPYETDPELFVTVTDVDAARQQVIDGTLAALLVLEPNYLNDGAATLFNIRAAPEELFSAIDTLLVTNLSATLDTTIPVARLSERIDVTINVLDGGRSFDSESVIFVTMLPVIFGFFLILASITTSSFLMSGLAEEKTTRIMEILVTSVTPRELLTGKVLGMGALGLMQVILFLAAGIIGLSVAQRSNILTGLSIPLDMAVLAIVYYLLSYFLLAITLAGIGAVAGSEQESRQLSVVVTLPVMLPYLAIIVFLIDPNGPIPTAMSLIPFTAPMAVLMRMGLTTVPLWQIAVSITGLILLDLVMLFLSARMFRWGILSYGKTPGLGMILRIMRGRTSDVRPVQQPQPSEG